MSTNSVPPSISLSDADKARAVQEAEAWALDYLDRVPFEDICRTLVEHALQQLLLALGPRYGKSAVSNVLEGIVSFDPQSAEGEDIRKRISEGDVSVLRHDWVDIDWQDLFAEFAHLFAYARYGYGRQAEPEASRAEIEALILHFRHVVADSSVRTVVAGSEWLSITLAAAEARWAIDHGRSAAPDDLAALADVKPKTIANLLAARELSADSDGRIPAAEALRYLERRDGFVRSNWQYPHKSSEESTQPVPLAEQVFVPVDGEGNPFLPSMARRGRDGVPRYAIGAKSDPEYVEDYWDALDHLARTPSPRWRRPPASGKGGWSLVSAQDGWRRFPRADLERMVRAVQEERANPRYDFRVGQVVQARA